MVKRYDSGKQRKGKSRKTAEDGDYREGGGVGMQHRRAASDDDGETKIGSQSRAKVSEGQ
eukprot:5737122-Pleurochrysis_carterae.AAC.1